MTDEAPSCHSTQFSAFNLLTAWELPIGGDVARPFVDSQTPWCKLSAEPPDRCPTTYPLLFYVILREILNPNS
jgi:hypothetical protein